MYMCYILPMLFLKCGYWVLEMALQDALRHYRITDVEPYFTAVFDLQHWTLKKQLPLRQAYRLAKRFVSIVPVCYPELLRPVTKTVRSRGTSPSIDCSSARTFDMTRRRIAWPGLDSMAHWMICSCDPQGAFEKSATP